jgi:RNA polymerase sigma-70 factor (ECF subfamily)
MPHEPREHSAPNELSSASGEPGLTATILSRARAGDVGAREQLAARFHPILRRLAHGRLPLAARGMLDTDDIVQNTLVRAFNRLDQFEPRHEGAFLAYLRAILLNQVRDEVRRASRRPAPEAFDDRFADGSPSPLERAVGRDLLERYERALARLGDDQREAVIMRVELGFSFAEIAAAIGRPTANAARLLVNRAFLSLARAMRDGS